MEQALQILSHPFTLGLLLGLLFFSLSLYAHIKTKMDFRRYRRHLSDKLELEAKHLETLKKEKEQLATENENLRIKTVQSAEMPQNKLERELEILARAEKNMMIQAPGFAPAWETAKSHALAEITEEERGNTLPKRIFRKFFGATSDREIPTEALPSPSDRDGDEQPAESRASNGS